MPDFWISDLSHYLTPEGMRVDGPPGGFAGYLALLVSAASAHPAGAPVATAVRCRRRPGRRPCPGHVVAFCPVGPGEVRWACPACGDRGLITGWAGSPWDMSRSRGRRPPGPRHPVPLSDDEWAALRRCPVFDPALDALIAAARFDGRTVVISGTTAELEDLGDALAAEVNHEPDRRRRRLLDAVCDRLLRFRALPLSANDG